MGLRRNGGYGALPAILVELLLIDLGIGMTSPVLPLYAQTLGAGVAMVGGIVGALGVSRVFFDLPAGYLAGRCDRRWLLLVAPLFTLGAAVMTATATNFWVLLPARFLEGTGSALANTASLVILADAVAGRENRGRIMSLYQGVRRGATGLAPFVGGLLADAAGYRFVYWGYAAATFLALIWVLVVLVRLPLPSRRVPPRSVDAGERRRLSLRGGFLFDPSFLLVSLMAFAFFFGRISVRRLIIPLLGKEVLGLSATYIGLALSLGTVATLVTLYFSGHLTDRMGAGKLVVLGGFLSALALVFYSFSDSLPTFLLASIFWGFTAGFGGPARNVYLMDIVSADLYPLAMGVYRTLGDLGFILGPVVLSLVAADQGLQASLYVAAGVFAVGSFLFGAFARRAGEGRGRDAGPVNGEDEPS